MSHTARVLVVAAGAWLGCVGASFVLLIVAAALAGPSVGGGEMGVAAYVLLSAAAWFAGTGAVVLVAWRSPRAGAGRWLVGLGFAAVAGTSWLLGALVALVVFNR